MRLTPDTAPEAGATERALLRAILTTLQHIARSLDEIRELLERDAA